MVTPFLRRILTLILGASAHECYILDVPSRCTAEEAEWIQDGSAVVKDYILIGRKNDSSEAGLNGDCARPGGDQIPLLAKDW